MSNTFRDAPVGATSDVYPQLPDAAVLPPTEGSPWPERLLALSLSGDSAPDTVGQMTAVVNISTQQFFDDFYNRIWVIPARLEVNNPPIERDIPFTIWNAYFVENELENILASGATGLTLDVAGGDVFAAFELRTVNLQILPTAPLSIEALFMFDFALGEGELLFISQRAYIVQDRPETPIEETWSWLSDVIEAEDGTEQRIALLDYPRRKFADKISVDGDELVRRQLALMFGQYGQQILKPLWQYQSRLKQAAAAGTFDVYVDSKRADLRAGRYMFLVGSEGSEIARIESLHDGYVTVDAPLQWNYNVRSIGMCATVVAMEENASFVRPPPNKSGSFMVNCREMAPLIPWLNPLSTAVLTMFNELPVLDKTPIGMEFSDGYVTGIEINDSDTGVLDVRNTKLHPQIVFSRRFLVQRFLDQDAMDYWRLMLNTVHGKTHPFYVSTDREDFELVVPPAPATSIFVVKGTTYSSVYFEWEPFKQIAIYTDAGVHYATVTSVLPEGVDDKLTFAPELPSGTGWETVNKVSFLLRVRLDSDDVKLTHELTHTFVDLEFRTTDQ